VVDSQTEADITRAILLQIIMEQEAGGKPAVHRRNAGTFHPLLRRHRQEAFTTFLDQSLDLFVKQQRMLQRTDAGMSGAAIPMEFWMKLGQQNMGFWQDMEA
jgi:polyhydroxyalkanoate synthesis regulator protein